MRSPVTNVKQWHSSAAAQFSSSTSVHAPLTCCCIPQEAAVAHVLAQARGPVQHHCRLAGRAGLFRAPMPAAGC